MFEPQRFDRRPDARGETRPKSPQRHPRHPIAVERITRLARRSLDRRGRRLPPLAGPAHSPACGPPPASPAWRRARAEPFQPTPPRRGHEHRVDHHLLRARQRDGTTQCSQADCIVLSLFDYLFCAGVFDRYSVTGFLLAAAQLGEAGVPVEPVWLGRRGVSRGARGKGGRRCELCGARCDCGGLTGARHHGAHRERAIVRSVATSDGRA